MNTRWLNRIRGRGVSRILTVNIANAIVVFATSTIMARTLDPQERGMLANLILWPTLFSHVFLSGIHVYLSRSTANKPKQAEINYRIGFLATTLTSSLAIIAYGIYSYISWAGYPLKNGAAPPVFSIIVAALIIPFSSWNTMQIQVELGRNKIRTYNYARYSFSFANFIFVALLFLVNYSSAENYLLAFILANMFSNVSTYFIVRSEFQQMPNFFVTEKNIRFGEVLEVFRKSLPFGFSTGLIALASAADKIVVSLFFDAHAMGVYVVALTLSQIHSIINESISPLFFARIAKKDKISQVDNNWLGMRLRQTFMINGIIGLFMFVFAPILTPIIFGKAYMDSVAVISILVPALVFRSMMRSYEEVLRGGNKPLSQSSAIIIMTSIFAAGAMLAAWAGSLRGVALALMLASVVGLGIVVVMVSRESGLGISKLLIPSLKDIRYILSEVSSIFKG